MGSKRLASREQHGRYSGGRLLPSPACCVDRARRARCVRHGPWHDVVHADPVSGPGQHARARPRLVPPQLGPAWPEQSHGGVGEQCVVARLHPPGTTYPRRAARKTRARAVDGHGGGRGGGSRQGRGGGHHQTPPPRRHHMSSQPVCAGPAAHVSDGSVEQRDHGAAHTASSTERFRGRAHTLEGPIQTQTFRLSSLQTYPWVAASVLWPRSHLHLQALPNWRQTLACAGYSDCASSRGCGASCCRWRPGRRHSPTKQGAMGG
mmetsp:Transcript_14949/g.32487  ORF Transcript_14949/g.32487 Transcript_14949/m.32487 type:complete len:263 (-) Transcript_14949:221-1009(-)